MERAFETACARFTEDGYAFGDKAPRLHLRVHGPYHPHIRSPVYGCPHCDPPVHGEPVLLTLVDGEVREYRPEEVERLLRERNVPPLAPPGEGPSARDDVAERCKRRWVGQFGLSVLAFAALWITRH